MEIKIADKKIDRDKLTFEEERFNKNIITHIWKNFLLIIFEHLLLQIINITNENTLLQKYN